MAPRVTETIEPSFRAFVARMFGEEGRAWIAGLPEAHATRAARWQLELGPELPGGLLSCVREARRANGSTAILNAGAAGEAWLDFQVQYVAAHVGCASTPFSDFPSIATT